MADEWDGSDDDAQSWLLPHDAASASAPDSELTLAESVERLCQAISWIASRRLGETVEVTVVGDLATAAPRPRWVSTGGRQSWMRGILLSVAVPGSPDVEPARARIEWPAQWDPSDAQPNPRTGDLLAPGVHRGLYLYDRPLAAGHGVRLREGVHVILSEGNVQGWRAQPVLSPTLGPEAFGDWATPALLGRAPSAYLRPESGVKGFLEGEAIAAALSGDLQGLSLAVFDGDGNDYQEQTEQPELWPGDRFEKKRPRTQAEIGLKVVMDRSKAAAEKLSESEAGPERYPPSRTAAARNRLMGPDEVMAELVYGYVWRRAWTDLSGREDVKPRSRKPAVRLPELVQVIRRAGPYAVQQIARGGLVSSVITTVDRGTTLTRIEQSSRTAFTGFRGLAEMLRGRADLRDLDPGWRGLLCPVQTPESTDVGLVRHTTVALRDDRPAPDDSASPGRKAPSLDELRQEWGDLSASAALIPFVNHNDPARSSIASKNMRQALPVSGAEPPLVATGWERVFGRNEGCATAPVAGTVTEIGDTTITLATPDGGTRVVAYGAPRLRRSGPENGWATTVEEDAWVEVGEILAHAPEVITHGRFDAELCLGVNALVALMPWQGLNFEDAIVVSRSFAKRLTSTHLVRIDEQLEPGEEFLERALTSAPVVAGQALFAVSDNLKKDDPASRSRTVRSPVAGTVLDLWEDRRRRVGCCLLRVERELAVGDKLSNRHQGKGVVSAILPDDEMPEVELPGEGGLERVDVILNPLGILRRLNIGQLWEMHVGLRARLGGEVAEDFRRTAQGQVIVGRRLETAENHDPGAAQQELAAALERCGAPAGRLPVVLPDGTRRKVVVGPQYLLKLDHLASSKVSVRGGQLSRSPISGQPSQTGHYRKGTRVGAAQRLGEMEVWALEAIGATEVLSDALTARAALTKSSGDTSDDTVGAAGEDATEQDAPRPSLRSIQAHLAVAGIDLITDAGRAQDLRWRKEVRTLDPRWASRTLADLPALDTAESWPRIGQQPPALEELIAMRGVMAHSPEPSTWTALHPLHRPDWHGAPGTLRAEQVRYAIPLPFEMEHPWRRTGQDDDEPTPAELLLKDTLRFGDDEQTQDDDESAEAEASAPERNEDGGREEIPLPKIKSVPLLPPAYRVAGRSPIDAAYRQLATEIARYRKAMRDADVRDAQADALRAALAAGEEEAARALKRLQKEDRSFKPEQLVEKRGGAIAAAEWEALRRAGWADTLRGIEALRCWKAAQKQVRLILGTPERHDPDSIWGRLSGKRGLLRRFTLGQSVTHSARAVIVPEPGLRPFEIGLPRVIAEGLGVIDAGGEPSKEPDGDVVFVNRQPSLHPYNLIALKARVVDGDAVRLHPLYIGALAGDFDGDTVAVHRPVTAAARRLSWELMRPAAVLRSSANGLTLAKLDLDIALGIQLLKNSKDGRKRLAKLLGKPGRDQLASITGAGRRAIAGSSPADLSRAIIDAAFDHPDAALRRLAKLEKAGWRAATGWSIGALDLVSDGRDGQVFAEAVAAGVAGNDEAIGQLFDRRGQLRGGYPGTPAPDVQHSFLQGLTNDEYFHTSPAAIAGLAEKKIVTPHAGALTKSLVEIADTVVIARGRCDVDDELRSPLTCQAEDGICAACYGKDPGTGRLLEPGRRIGVLAATLVGERSTQKAMKVFHAGGQAGVLGKRVIRDLRSVFGKGTANLLRAGRRNDEAAWDDPRYRLEVLRPVVGEVVAMLEGRVDAVHVEVLLRQLLDVFLQQGRVSANSAEGFGRTAVERATARGSISHLIERAQQVAEQEQAAVTAPVGGFRLRLAAGDVK